MNNKEFVSIIIVNFNGLIHLKECLESLQLIDYKEYEIIIVDNNSTDNSVNFVQNNFPNIKIIQLDYNQGFAKANNISAKKARGDYLLFLNNDTLVKPDFLRKLMNEIKSDERIAMCQPLLVKPDDTIDSSGDFVDIHGRSYQRKIVVDKKEILSGRGAAILIKKKIFWKLGGFDEKFFFGFEDIDLGWRCWIYGYKVILVRESIVIHKGGQSVNQIGNSLFFHSIKNNIVLRYVNFDGKYVLKSLLTFFIDNLFRKTLKKSLLSELEYQTKIPSFHTIFSSLAWIIGNLSYLQDKKKKTSLNRKRSTKDLIQLGLITQ